MVERGFIDCDQVHSILQHLSQDSANPQSFRVESLVVVADVGGIKALERQAKLIPHDQSNSSVSERNRVLLCPQHLCNFVNGEMAEVDFFDNP